MILEDAFGLRTEIRFHDVQRNPPLDASLFSFEPPVGVERTDTKFTTGISYKF